MYFDLIFHVVLFQAHNKASGGGDLVVSKNAFHYIANQYIVLIEPYTPKQYDGTTTQRQYRRQYAQWPIYQNFDQIFGGLFAIGPELFLSQFAVRNGKQSSLPVIGLQ